MFDIERRFLDKASHIIILNISTPITEVYLPKEDTIFHLVKLSG